MPHPTGFEGDSGLVSSGPLEAGDSANNLSGGGLADLPGFDRATHVAIGSRPLPVAKHRRWFVSLLLVRDGRAEERQEFKNLKIKEFQMFKSMLRKIALAVVKIVCEAAAKFASDYINTRFKTA